MKQLSRCCCCTVRTGSLVIAALSILCTGLAVAGYSYILAKDLPEVLANGIRRQASTFYHNERITESDYRLIMWKADFKEDFMEILCAVIIAFAVVKGIFACLLLTGILKNNHKLMLPWMIMASIAFALACLLVLAGSIFMAVKGSLCNAGVYFSLGICHIVLCSYLLRVVHSEYKNIKEASNDEKPTPKKAFMVQNILADQPYKIMA